MNMVTLCKSLSPCLTPPPPPITLSVSRECGVCLPYPGHRNVCSSLLVVVVVVSSSSSFVYSRNLRWIRLSLSLAFIWRNFNKIMTSSGHISRRSILWGILSPSLPFSFFSHPLSHFFTRRPVDVLVLGLVFRSVLCFFFFFFFFRLLHLFIPS